jgi:hypothetical protein
MISSDFVPDRPNSISEVFMDADDAAILLSINRRTLLHWARTGVVPAHPLGVGTRKPGAS